MYKLVKNLLNNLNQVRAKEERAERLRREKESSAEKVKSST